MFVQFFMDQTLSEHNDTVHESKKKQLNCTKCEATFGKSYQLNQHIKICNSISTYFNGKYNGKPAIELI